MQEPMLTHGDGTFTFMCRVHLRAAVPMLSCQSDQVFVTADLDWDAVLGGVLRQRCCAFDNLCTM